MKPDKRPFLIAVTGGIGSGKSLVSEWFQKQGYAVYYTDRIGHGFLEDSAVREELLEEFGKKILGADDTIDRKLLGKLVFASENKRLQLNRILHPRILEEMRQIITGADRDVLIFEIPLLFESEMEDLFDLIINIAADRELRIKRLIARDGLTEEEVISRIDSQLEDKFRIERSNHTVFNNGTVEELLSKLEELEKTVRKKMNRN